MEGALSLAIPLNVGQSLTIIPKSDKVVHWQANKPDGHWFFVELDLFNFNVTKTDNYELAQRLSEILSATRILSKDFLTSGIGYNVVTDLEFDPDFGFGTSSTLIANIASWANVDAYKLLDLTFGGSGYDIACASSKNPIVFQRIGDSINVSDVSFDPVFKKNLYFVYLGKKQNSTNSISHFKKHSNFTSVDVDAISAITKELLITSELAEFEALLAEHESIMESILNIPTAKSLYFKDYPGIIKSLGAWGGDFVMLTNHYTEKEFRNLLQEGGFDTVFSYDSLVM